MNRDINTEKPTENAIGKPQEMSLDDIRNITAGKPETEVDEGAACDIRKPEACEDE